MTIGEKLKELRKIADKTVAKVAEDSGILPARVSFYEMDKGIPTIPILQKLAKGLDCTIFDIIDEPLGRKKTSVFTRKFVHSIRKNFYMPKRNRYNFSFWCYSAFDIIRHFMKFMV